MLYYSLITILINLIFIKLLKIHEIRCSNLRQIEKAILDDIIGEDSYDNRIRPSGSNRSSESTDGSCQVTVNILIRSISKISDLDMEYSAHLTFREEWTDERLAYSDKDTTGHIRYLTLTDPDRIWKPDLFFRNEKEGHTHNIIMPNVLLRIYPHGKVLYSIRISLVLSCLMDLKYYPLDRQTCSISMASYGYTTEDVKFKWKRDQPVQINSGLHLPRFQLEKSFPSSCTSSTNTGEYSCIKVDLLFRREFSYYLIHIYIPCIMLVIVSWVSFWLDANAIPARVSLGVTTLLTMATQISGINASLPQVSYIKAVDVWTESCLTFVFGALLEFALVNYYSRYDAQQAALKSNNNTFLEKNNWENNSNNIDVSVIFDLKQIKNSIGKKSKIHANYPIRSSILCCWLTKVPTHSKKIDVVARIFFPATFVLFNVVYWITYLFREDLQNIDS